MGTTAREADLPDDHEQILTLVDDEALRVEEIAEREDMDFEAVRDAIQDLWERNLVVSGPDFEFEADRDLPPNLE
ncbi:hypothetical protein [Halorhabdus rudnickae]|uniref:hypothetical protein n=1 Tax=Halorhabdus rudnickae TaxID=1775544 RepID=UPI001083E629|nr:hypothetical protein [Halorhabdus rudnickae]